MIYRSETDVRRKAGQREQRSSLVDIYSELAGPAHWFSRGEVTNNLIAILLSESVNKI